MEPPPACQRRNCGESEMDACALSFGGNKEAEWASYCLRRRSCVRAHWRTLVGPINHVRWRCCARAEVNQAIGGRALVFIMFPRHSPADQCSHASGRCKKPRPQLIARHSFIPFVFLENIRRRRDGRRFDLRRYWPPNAMLACLQCRCKQCQAPWAADAFQRPPGTSSLRCTSGRRANGQLEIAK